MKEYTLKGTAPQDHQHEPLVTPTPGGPHYAKETCRHCGQFLRWLPKPENIEKRAAVASLVKRLSGLALTGWNRTFIQDLVAREQSKFSPKQLEHIERIAKENGIS